MQPDTTNEPNSPPVPPVQTVAVDPEKKSKIVRWFGWFLLAFGLVSLFAMLSDASDPKTALGTDDQTGSDIGSFWLNFGFISILLIGGSFLIESGKPVIKILRKFFIVIPVLFIIIFAATIQGTFNGLVFLDQEIESQLGDIRVAYQQRADLVEPLLTIAREPLQQEKDIQLTLASARGKIATSKSVDETIQGANQFEQTLSKLVFLVEQYPTLRETKEYQNAQVALVDSTKSLTLERKIYNERVKQYNLMVKSFPTVLLARTFSYSPHEFWNATTNLDSQ